jgi:uncharacterized protein YutE (UPF0331/DUF86 family)
MPPTLQEKIAQLRDYVRELRDTLAQTAGGDRSTLVTRALERLVQVIVECAADAGDLWLEAHGRPVGQTAATVFQFLHEAGAIDAEHQTRLRRHTSVRNRIVHDYDRVTPEQVRQTAEALANDAEDLIRRLTAG